MPGMCGRWQCQYMRLKGTYGGRLELLVYISHDPFEYVDGSEDEGAERRGAHVVAQGVGVGGADRGLVMGERQRTGTVRTIMR